MGDADDDWDPRHGCCDPRMHVKNWSRSCWGLNYSGRASSGGWDRLSQKQDEGKDEVRIRAKELVCPASLPATSSLPPSLRSMGPQTYQRLHSLGHRPALTWIAIVIFFLLATLPSSSLIQGKNLSPSAESSESPSSSNESSNSSSSNFHNLNCKPGLMLPVWEPLVNLSTGDCVARGIVYFLSLCYLFLGVSIISDRFMGSIEVITSQEKDVTITKPNGEQQTISVRIWNETVANLTLMALGSSAPEIMLSVIEIYTQNFDAGDLGPGTIVGSAAFNLFVIIGVCVWIIPSPQVKKIKHLRVFCITMIWSVFAYIWMYAIVVWSSAGVVTVWEGLLTFLFFPLTVGTAYIADRRLLVYKYLSKEYRANKRGVIVGTEGGEDGDDMEMGATQKDTHRRSTIGVIRASLIGDPYDEVTEFERHRMEYISLLKELRRKNPNAPIDEIEQLARDEIANRGPKSRAFYRMQVSPHLLCTQGAFVLHSPAAPVTRSDPPFETRSPNLRRVCIFHADIM